MYVLNLTPEFFICEKKEEIIEKNINISKNISE